MKVIKLKILKLEFFNPEYLKICISSLLKDKQKLVLSKKINGNISKTKEGELRKAK